MLRSNLFVIRSQSRALRRGLGIEIARNVIIPMRPTKATGVDFRSFSQSTGKKDAALEKIDVERSAMEVAKGSNMVPTTSAKDMESEAKENQIEYLKQLSLKELVSYLVIGVCTINKPILNLCIKVFPYVPLWVIKKLVYTIYGGGEAIEEVKETGKRLSKRGINNMMISLTIEACDGNDNVNPDEIVNETIRSVDEIMIPHTLSVIKESGKSINAIPPAYVALKPTGFAKNAANVLQNFRNDSVSAKEFDNLCAKVSRIVSHMQEENERLAALYPERTAPFVVATIDAERFNLQDGVYELQRRLYSKFNPTGKPITVIGTLQMYLSESAQLLSMEEKLAKENGYRLGLKLVRGAYIHSEPNRSVIHKDKAATDTNYNNGIAHAIDSILASESNDSVIGHLVVASHNRKSLEYATENIQKATTSVSDNNKNNIVLGQLLGMADGITTNLIKHRNVDNVIKYVPWGPPLETKEYMLRRLEENGDAVRSDNGIPLLKAVFFVIWKRLTLSA